MYIYIYIIYIYIHTYLPAPSEVPKTVSIRKKRDVVILEVLGIGVVAQDTCLFHRSEITEMLVR